MPSAYVCDNAILSVPAPLCSSVTVYSDGCADMKCTCLLSQNDVYPHGNVDTPQGGKNDEKVPEALNAAMAAKAPEASPNQWNHPVMMKHGAVKVSCLVKYAAGFLAGQYVVLANAPQQKHASAIGSSSNELAGAVTRATSSSSVKHTASLAAEQPLALGGALHNASLKHTASLAAERPLALGGALHNASLAAGQPLALAGASRTASLAAGQPLALAGASQHRSRSMVNVDSRSVLSVTTYDVDRVQEINFAGINLQVSSHNGYITEELSGKHLAASYSLQGQYTLVQPEYHK